MIWRFIIGRAQAAFDVGLPFSGTHHYDSFAAYFQDLLGFAIDVAAVLAILVIVYAGFLYTKSRGQSDQISLAKELIAGALTGLAILILIRLVVPTLGIQTQ